MKFREKEKFGFRNTLHKERGGRFVLKISTGEISMNIVKAKGKLNLVHAMKTKRWSRSIALLFLQTRRLVGVGG